MSTPQISTVMLCWNRLYLSKQSLESYLQNTNVPYELIIVNNASSDGTAEWANSLESDPRITLVMQRDQNNSAEALNNALAKCTAPLFHVMENDGIYLPGWDEYVLDRFERLPDLGQLGLDVPAERHIAAHYIDAVFLATRNVGSTSVFRRSLFAEQNIRWTISPLSGAGPGDGVFSAEIRKRGFKVAWGNKVLIHNIGHSESEFASNPSYYFDNYWRKLTSNGRLKWELKRILRGDFSNIAFLKRMLGILCRLFYYRTRKKIRG